MGEWYLRRCPELQMDLRSAGVLGEPNAAPTLLNSLLSLAFLWAVDSLPLFPTRYAEPSPMMVSTSRGLGTGRGFPICSRGLVLAPATSG